MKTKIVFVLLIVAGVAVAVAPYNTDQIGRWVQGSLYVMPKSLAAGVTTTNAVTRMLGGSETVDFASASITCVDSTGHTVTGAQVGDACSVGTPAAATANATFSCYVSAANTVKIRFLPSWHFCGPGVSFI